MPATGVPVSTGKGAGTPAPRRGAMARADSSVVYKKKLALWEKVTS